MTRAQGPAFEIEYRSVGPAEAPRTVLVLRSGPIALTDPEPGTTRRHGVRLLLVEVGAAELDNPPTFGGETPAESAAAEVFTLLREEVPRGVVGLVGERAAALFTVALAAGLGARVDRLALVAAPPPDSPLAADLTAATLGRVPATTAIFNGSRDATAPPDAAEWYAAHLASARADIIPPSPARAGDARLALADVWDRVLTHVDAPIPSP